MFTAATEKSPTDINTIIRREFVLKSGHIQKEANVTNVPASDSEAAVVDKTLFKLPLAILEWFGAFPNSVGSFAKSKKFASKNASML